MLIRMPSLTILSADLTTIKQTKGGGVKSKLNTKYNYVDSNTIVIILFLRLWDVLHLASVVAGLLGSTKLNR